MARCPALALVVEMAVRLTSSSALSSPTGGAGTRRSCRAPRSWSALSRAVQSRSRTSRASPSPPLLSVSGPRIWRQCVAPVGQLVREEAVEVRLSCRAAPHGRSTGSAPPCWREGGPDPPQPPVEEAGMSRPSPPSPPGGQEVRDYRSLCWFGWRRRWVSTEYWGLFPVLRKIV